MGNEHFSNWVLSSFSTVEEVRTALKEIVPVSIPGGLGGIGETEYHFWISDTSGKGIVVEPISPLYCLLRPRKRHFSRAVFQDGLRATEP